MKKKMFIMLFMFVWLTSVFAFIQNIDNSTNILHLLNYKSDIVQKDNKLYFVNETSIDEFKIQTDGSLTFIKFLQNEGFSFCKPLIIGDSLYVIGRSIDETIPEGERENYLQIIDISGEEMELSEKVQLCLGYSIMNLIHYNHFLIYNLSWDGDDHVYDLTTHQEVANYEFGQFCTIKDSLLISGMYSSELDSTRIEFRDISNISNPQLISRITFSPSLGLIKYKFAGNILYVFGDSKIKIIDISDITNPTISGTISNIPGVNPPNDSFLKADIYGNYLIFNDTRNYFWVYDISDLTNPQFVQIYQNLGSNAYKAKPGFITVNNGFMYEIDAMNQLCQINLNSLPELNIVNHFGITGQISEIHLFNNWFVFWAESGFYALNTLAENEGPICLSSGNNNKKLRSVNDEFFITGNDSLVVISDYPNHLKIYKYNTNDIVLKNTIEIQSGFSLISRYNQYYFLYYPNTGLVKVFTIDEDYNLDEIVTFTKGDNIYLAQMKSHYTLPYIPATITENNYRYLCLLNDTPPFNEYTRIPISQYSINFLENDNIITVETDFSSKFGTFELPNQINYFDTAYDSYFKLHDDCLFKLDTINTLFNDGHAEFYSFLNHNYEELFEYDFDPNIFNAFLSGDHESLYSIHRYNIYKYDCDYVPNNDDVIPSTNNYSLSNYPNPFNPTTTISFDLPKSAKVDLSIYNIKGQKVKTLTSEKYSKGKHSLIWNGTNDENQNVGSGVYFYKLNVNGKIKSVKKCMMVK